MNFTFLFFLLFLGVFVNSQDCQNSKLASTDVLESVQIYSNAFALEDDHVSFEIASSAPSNSFDQVSDPIQILLNNQSACPSTCTVTLNRYTDTFQGNQSTILFFDTEHSFYLPSHYVHDNKTKFVCVSTNGSCGATVPIYRYYRISSGGVYHAYSFDKDEIYDGYNQEFMPICYGWSVSTGTVASRPACGSLNFDTPLSALGDLKIYDNGVDGVERDHYYTTLASTDSSLFGYNQTGVLGKVLLSSKSTACSCLVKLQQQFDNQTGYFHRLDHKLIATGMESNRPYEEYQETGETVYCAKRLGDCGATLPLWKHFQFYDIDTIYTTDSAPIPMSYLYPQTPLCYIWSPSYSPNISNIPAAPPTFASLASTQTIGTTTVSTGSLLSTTHQADVGGITPINVNNTQSTTPSVSPPTNSLTTNPGLPGPSTVSVWGTSTPGTSGTTASTVSVWGTSSSGTSGTTASTISVWGTNSPTTPSGLPGPSTVSVWGTSTPGTSGTTASTISVWGTNSPTTPSGLPGPSTVSVWGTSTPGTSGTTASTISVWGTTSPATLSTSGVSSGTFETISTSLTTSTGLSTTNIATSGSNSTAATSTIPRETSTVSIGGTVGSTFTQTTTGTTGTKGTTTTTSAATGATSNGSSHLSDSGGSGVVLDPIPTRSGMLETMEAEVTEVYESTQDPLEEEGGGIDPTVPEMFTLSNFWYLTTAKTSSSSVTSPTIRSSFLLTNATVSSTDTVSTVATLPPTVAMITGPLFGSLNIPSNTMAPPVSVSSSSPPTTLQYIFSSGKTTEITVSSPSTTVSSESVVQQSVPVNSIIGGPLSEYTNAPIIQALISSSLGSTTGSVPEKFSDPVKRDIEISSTSTTTESPGIIWKAGDWISSTWHSVFGGNDSDVFSSTSSTDNNTFTSTTHPIGGLVGSLINSTGNFYNDTKTFLGNTIVGVTNGENGTVGNPISSFINNTGQFIDHQLNSTGTIEFYNNTKNWLDDKMNSTGEFLSSAWNFLAVENGTSEIVNGTKTWLGGAVNSASESIGNAWNETEKSSETFVNSSRTWVNQQLNGTAVGNFLNSTGGAIVGNVTSVIGGLVGGEKEVVIMNDSNEEKSLNISVPLSNLMASSIHSAVNQTSTPSNLKIEWNGRIINGPIRK